MLRILSANMNVTAAFIVALKQERILIASINITLTTSKVLKILLNIRQQEVNCQENTIKYIAPMKRLLIAKIGY